MQLQRGGHRGQDVGDLGLGVHQPVPAAPGVDQPPRHQHLHRNEQNRGLLLLPNFLREILLTSLLSPLTSKALLVLTILVSSSSWSPGPSAASMCLLTAATRCLVTSLKAGL